MREILNKLNEFANKHGLTLETKGECGFMRDCVGYLNKRGSNYLDYNPYDVSNDYEYIKELYDDRFRKLAPENAYHKHNCFAVLVHNEDYDKGLRELCEWINKLEEAGELEVVKYDTGARGIQAMLSGTHGYALKFKG